MKDLNTMDMPALQPIAENGYCVQELTILNKHGLHARPSAKIFEKILMPYGDQLELHFDIQNGDSFQIQSVFDLMSLGLEQGTQLKARIKINGSGEDARQTEKNIAEELHSLFLSFCED
jgi:phosphotransferase system HPr (HPr) family protein